MQVETLDTFPVRGLSDRDAQMVVMRESGATLESIGVTFGISRERVRQVLERHGVRGVGLEPDVDPLVIMRVIRRRETRSFLAVAEAVGIAPVRVRRAVGRLGLMRAVSRLFRWRHHRALVDRFAQLAAALGHTPTVLDVRAAGMHQSGIQKYCGGMQAIARRAGLTPNESGRRIVRGTP